MAHLFFVNFVVQYLFGWDLTPVSGHGDEEADKQQTLLEKHQPRGDAVDEEWPNDLGVSFPGHARLG